MTSRLTTRFLRALKTKPADYSYFSVMTALSIFVHGYHMGTDDAAIYAPAIEKAADPSLFPVGL